MSEAVDDFGVPSWRWCGNVVDMASRPAARQQEGIPVSEHDEGTRRWSIGELAEASGLTVRALHHYDEIGLVPAGERTRAGHRRYTGGDVRRLYRVQALRQLGLSLDEIATVLERSAEDLSVLRDLLETQLADLDVETARIAEVKRQVQGLMEQLEGAAMPEPAQFLATLETLPLVHAYLSRHQRDALVRRRSELGDETVETLRSEWLGLAADLRRHLRDGVPVDDPRVRALATRWEQIGTTFRTGDERVDDQIRTVAEAMWRENRATISQRVGNRIGWSDPTDLAEIVDYVHLARHASDGGGDRTTGGTPR
jgi:DNA-binding transcriptional MerR regulator